jgi:hypothetical protein
MADPTMFDDEPIDAPTPGGYGYIVDQHPGDLAAQRALARRLLAYGQTALDQADNQARELEAEAALLLSQAGALRNEAIDTNERQRGHVSEWYSDPVVRLHFGKKLLLGRYTVAWGKRARTYTVDERAVLRRAEVDPTLAEAGLVEYKVNRSAVRVRYQLDKSGHVVDTTTGEVVDEPIFSVTDEGGMVTKITVGKE